MSDLTDFATFFHALWGKEPFPWQSMLAAQAAAGDWPDVIDLPTAAGKTACIDIAVYALAAQADLSPADRSAARRIWFVVDRRIVVDEAFERAELLAEKLDKGSAPAIRAVSERLLALRGLPGQERPLAVGRLRGGVLRDDRWASVPSQAAVITSTVDQLGSRLLFRSYGCGQLAAPVYAGLAGNDSLVLLDEAHCAEPFRQTLMAVQRYRSPAWAEKPHPSPFRAMVLSATPRQEKEAGGDAASIFPRDEEERSAALDHQALQARLRSSKPAELLEVADESLLPNEMARAAAGFVEQGLRRVGVIVNRVARAKEIAAALRRLAKSDDVGETFEVALLTGRIRPIERDLLVGPRTRLHNVLRSSAPEEPSLPLILVATQCLEVGADFSFDALVTECASLDALRQRFGRLARLGQPDPAPAAVFAAKEGLKGGDPIYGEALKATWSFLSERAEVIEERRGRKKVRRRVFDFGFESVRGILEAAGDVEALLAPADDAPVLLPAYLDLLSQTSERVHPDPDVSPFLHGKGRGIPEAQVIWRSDLDPARSREWPEILSVCRPTAGETLSVPLHHLRRWLRDQSGIDGGGDVEGRDTAPETNAGDHGRAAGKFLLWRGRGRSEVSQDPGRIAPGDLVVLPIEAAGGAADALGQALRERGFGEGRLDLWELARVSAGRPAALRLHRSVLAPWTKSCPPLADLIDLAHSEAWTIRELCSGLQEVASWQPEGGYENDFEPLPDWLRQTILAVSGALRRDVATHPGGGLILQAAASAKEPKEPDLFADEDDGWSEASVEVTLADHTEQVTRIAAAFGLTCLDCEEARLLEAAALWHDGGKLDPRFQSVLRGGAPWDEESPLAKSPAKPRSREREQAVKEAVGLPVGFRHEMLSMQLAERFACPGLFEEERELLLHLIASHHGHARPFAPVCVDSAPEPLDIGEPFVPGGASLDAADRESLPAPHRLDSGVADRFWRLSRRYGWWGLAYREAILRLADWRASADPKAKQERDEINP